MSQPRIEGLAFFMLPDGRTLVRDDLADSYRRWTILRPGWREALQPAPYAPYLHFWCDVLEHVEPRDLAEIMRVVRTLGTD